jgi:lipid-A-disaccharide synthase
MHVFFSVGEPSGDQHAAHLIAELRRRRSELRVCGFGGPLMEQAGCHLLFPLTTLAVIGIFRVLPFLWTFYRQIQRAGDYFRRHRPDVVVLVDFPGFNWWIARKAKRLGIPVVYYLPPQLWAWAPWRIQKVRRDIDLVLSGLPFETEWYAQRGARVKYVGHPFFDEIAERHLDQSFLREWTSEQHPVVALLPGSRHQEVTRNWPLMLAAVRRLSELHPQAQFLVANYKESHRQFCREILIRSGETLPISFFVGKTPEIIAIARCAIMVSGSVSLEFLARGVPATVVYSVSRLTYLIGKLLVSVKSLTLPNLIAGRPLLPEHLCVGNPEQVVDGMTADIDRWLCDEEARQRTRMELLTLRDQLFQTGASGRVAAILLGRYEKKDVKPTPIAA